MDTQQQYPNVPTADVFGLPISRLNFPDTVAYIESLVDRRQAAYFITAPLHYAMLSRHTPALREVNQKAALLVADGMPLVWLSRWKRQPIQQRVAGSDLMPALCEAAARRGESVFLLGAAPGVGLKAAKELQRRFPGLKIAGVEWPRMSALSPEEELALVQRIRDSRPAFLFVARGQPDGEIWLSKHYQTLECVSVQIGASIDFVAGGVSRAPGWMQRFGLEWGYRAWKEPGRLWMRYAKNAAFLMTQMPLEILRNRLGLEHEQELKRASV